MNERTYIQYRGVRMSERACSNSDKRFKGANALATKLLIKVQ